MVDSLPEPRLRVVPFGRGDALDEVGGEKQRQYLRRYLADLGTRSILVEPVYFDREYLAEFAAFYAVSARAHGNRCRRLHFFTEDLTDAHLEDLLAGSVEAKKRFSGSYAGFAVVRPIPHAPWGRTVLQWYPPDPDASTQRVTNPSRRYTVTVAGIPLEVTGLAWLQQDTGVGSCSTVALWSALQSSAFDPYYAVPTTTAVTLAGNERGTFGSRVFPSRGMHVHQLGEAINELGLAPAIFDSDRSVSAGRRGFSRERFTVLLATLLRSGYPVVLGGALEEETPQGHAVCAVGFRTASSIKLPKDAIVAHEDSGLDIVYIHDDNIGPNVRCRVSESADGLVELRPEAPATPNGSEWPDPGAGYPAFRPTTLIAAVHHEMRLGADRFVARCLAAANGVAAIANEFLKADRVVPPTWRMQTQFMRQPAYLGDVLQTTLGTGAQLASVRRQMLEHFEPMSLHIGVLRIGRTRPELDVVYDTTGSDSAMLPFFHVAYGTRMEGIVELVRQHGGIDLGPGIILK